MGREGLRAAFKRAAVRLRAKAAFSVAVMAATMVAVFAIVIGASMPARYKIVAGERSAYDISAPYRLVDEARTERLAREAANSAPLVYTRDAEEARAIIDRTDGFAEMVKRENGVYAASIAAATTQEAAALLDRSVTRLVDRCVEHGVAISREEAASIISEIEEEQIARFFSDLRARVKAYSEMEITPDNLGSRVVSLQRSIQSMYANQNLKNVGAMFAVAALSSNVVEDMARTQELWDQVYQQNLERKTIIERGERILNVGDYVSVDKLATLAAFGLADDGVADLRPAVRVGAIVFGVSALLLLAIGGLGATRFVGDRGQAVILSSVIVFVLLLCRLLHPVHMLALPVYIAPIILSYLFGLRVALAATGYLVILVSLFTGVDVASLTVFLVGGSASAMLVWKASQRARFTLAGAALAAVNIAMFVVQTPDIAHPSSYYEDAGVLLIASFGSALLSLGLVTLIEGAFNTATPLRLTELISGNSALLRRLSFEAPGTHHHSLMVSYMAEAASAEIGADAFLAKAGAMFHDVGKLASPEYFSENQHGVNPHDSLEPEDSSRIIVAHVPEGVALCERAKLPRHVTAIVREHHGETQTAYFYQQAVAKYGEGSVDKSKYTYPGPKPSTREAAIVMLADSCEAAVRSSGRLDEAEIASWVGRIVKGKLDSGQLVDSDISVRDIDRVCGAFTRVLCGYYHARVQYLDVARPPAPAPDATRSLAHAPDATRPPASMPDGSPDAALAVVEMRPANAE